jgi:hypothetical protein
MNYLVQPQSLIDRAIIIPSFSSMFSKEQIQFSELSDIATQIVEEWSSDWDEGCGFGSSDGTYMLKDFIDTVIDCFTNSVYNKSGYQTVFNPTLSVEYKYSESELVSFEDNGEF